ncbi:MAG: protein kinase [Kofleriaceae bacterium]
MGLELEDTQAAPATDRSDRTATKPGGGSNGDLPRLPVGLPAGKQLGHFRIERPLGAGGMGEVYLATDLALDRPVAIKVLPELIAHDPKRRDRMIREARAQARVAHPNVGHMYFIGEADDRLYFAMEYVAGQTLADRVADGPLPVDDALAVIRGAVLGLREAQRSGFTHRDVKPSNLMIDGHGIVKVLDFGLAAGSEGGEADDPLRPVAQTSLAGTPLYMAPEQARGEAVDFRSDIYALGATLYHLIAGKPPFYADSVDQLVSMHATAARPVLPKKKGHSRAQAGAVHALCTRMMAAVPDERFSSYDELLRALDIASSTQTRPGGYFSRNIAMLIDLLLVSLVAAAVMGIRVLIGGDLNVSLPVVIPVMFLVQWLGIARWGTTPGKALVELEVVDITTLGRPRLARALRRALLLFGLPMVTGISETVVERFTDYTIEDVVNIIDFSWVALGQIVLWHASIRVAGKRTGWDRLTGTMVRYRTGRTPLARE